MNQIPPIHTLKNILILRGEGSLGDAIISSCCYRNLKKANPAIKITVACFAAGYEFLKDNPYIDELVKLPVRTLIRPNQRWISLTLAAMRLRLRHFDLVLDSSTKKYYNWRLFKWIAGGDKVLDCFTSPIQPFGALDKHGSEHEQAILKLLGIQHPDTAYDLPISSADRQAVSIYLETHRIDSYILLNPAGSTDRRKFSPGTLHTLCQLLAPLGKPIVIPSSAAHYSHWQSVFKEQPRCFVMQTAHLGELFEVVRKAALVISPDTSVVHIASGFQKLSLVFYNELSPYIAPNNPHAFIVQTGRENVNSIAWETVKNQLSLLQPLLTK